MREGNLPTRRCVCCTEAARLSLLVEVHGILRTYSPCPDEIVKDYQNSDLTLKKKRNRLSNCEDVDAALLQWF